MASGEADGGAGAQIEHLLGEIERHEGDEARDRARALVGAVLEWHRAGLERLMEMAGSAGDAMARDPQVGSMLALHGLHPVAIEERARAAVERLNPEVRGLGGIARVIGAQGGVVRVSLEGEGARGPIGRRMRALIESAIHDAAPDVDAVVIEGPPADDGELVPLERLLAGPPRAPAAVVARVDRDAGAADACETCGAPLAEDHAHVFEPRARELRCVCAFCVNVGGTGAWKLVPPRAELLPGFAWSDEEWARAGAPISVAFFQRSSASSRVVAFYPSPAGAVEGEVARDTWARVVVENPGIADLADDVEALVVHRIGSTRAFYRVSIDRAYALVGLLRRHWRGFTGGPAAWREVAAYFAALESARAGAP